MRTRFGICDGANAGCDDGCWPLVTNDEPLCKAFDSIVRIATGLGTDMLMNREQPPRAAAARSGDASLQLFGGAVAAAGIPLLVAYLRYGPPPWQGTAISNSILASLLAAAIALFMFRKMTAFPGTGAFAYIIPCFSIAYGVAAVLLLWLRVEYVSSLLLSGIVASVSITFFLAHRVQYGSLRCFYMVPFGNTLVMNEMPNIEWRVMHEPKLPVDHALAPIVADLRYDHEPAWERMLAEAAISGRPVYHTKQLRESMTGKVEIEHLSENSFGSLLPNMAYCRIKRFMDIVTSVILLPMLTLPLAVVALLIKLDSDGPIFFRQTRMGFRGRAFDVLKFRTMTHRLTSADEVEARADAITQADDKRITRVGRFLRRTRIDELPQIVNVLRGEMSWIGPRPEALPLSQWYERELPFYSYRHIVRPGISGWAQVNQGHVADLNSVNIKLQYDFFYIKQFSAWLDVLIIVRTMRIILSGFGAK